MAAQEWSLVKLWSNAIKMKTHIAYVPIHSTCVQEVLSAALLKGASTNPLLLTQ